MRPCVTRGDYRADRGANPPQHQQALQLSDDQRCKDKATHANGLFCWFHSKQVFGLYTGYKNRNAQLDAFDDDAPLYLKNGPPLANDDFEGIQDEATLREVHSHLFKKYVLIGKVIDARKLHHKHFYPLHIDYGHQAYLDKLSSQRHTVLRALERLEKRTAQVLYEKEKWFAWVREVQEDEEANREKEQKKVKQEAALFKRHLKKLNARLAKAREAEDQRRQDAYLEDAYRERMEMSADEASEDDAIWDPIDDMEDNKRNRYIDLIKHFLWIDVMDVELEDVGTSADPQPNPEQPTGTEEPQEPPKKTKKKGKAKAGSTSVAQAAIDNAGQQRILQMQRSQKFENDPQLQEPDKKNIETEAEMRKRLSQGVAKKYEGGWGAQLIGTMETPHETYEKTAPMTDDEIESIVRDMREIKLLLFCRLLLAQASMLPSALRANSVEEFLNDAEVTESDLRDLCLKVEEPSLQQVRDACADFARRDTVDEDDEMPDAEHGDSDDFETDESDESDDEDFEDMLREEQRYKKLHTDSWLMNSLQKAADKEREKEQGGTAARPTQVSICGKRVWNHASENAMTRDGWLQFSVIAKDCNLKHAIQLCRNWAEFSELNLLTLWQYFPASNWASWATNRLIQQLHELEFFPYFLDLEAHKHSRRFQVGGRSFGRRQHDIVETRNIMVGHMKRNDPVTRRFLQYLTMRTGELLVLVRDGKTGRVITAPPEEHLWTYRKKKGVGRASKNEWENLLELGPDYFDMTDHLREWRFGFTDYYDIFIWSFAPDHDGLEMYNTAVMELRNAWRIKHPRDVYLHMEPFLRTLTREEDTMRTRQIKPGEEVGSLWDMVVDERTEFVLFNVDGTQVNTQTVADLATSPYMFYNEANAAEDAILFPDEDDPKMKNKGFRKIKNGVTRIEAGIMPASMRSLVKGMRAIDIGLDPFEAVEMSKDTDEDSEWALPIAWQTGIAKLRAEKPNKEQRDLLKRVGLLNKHKAMGYEDRVNQTDPMQIMERDRSVGFKETFHDGDLEPGSKVKYVLAQGMIAMMLDNPHNGPVDWVWFIIRIMDWLKVKADDDGYTFDPQAPWPHSFILHDMIQAFAAVAVFFPESNITRLATLFLGTPEAAGFRNSLLFDPVARSKERPDRRTRTSFKFRDPAFRNEWKKFLKADRYYAEVYPLDWAVVARSTVAKLYRAGVIAPAYLQNHPEVVAGMATVNEEPHRPGKKDLFISYDDRFNLFPTQFPRDFVGPDKWTQLLPLAQLFANENPGARFALLRLWSAPHFYPYMVGPQNRQGISFLDSAGRSWEWNFVPKDMPGSEFSAHASVAKRIEYLRKQFGDRVVSRGDLIIVMGLNADDLLHYVTAVTFALQTKPWIRELDLWKSFINVDMEFLRGLESHWFE